MPDVDLVDKKKAFLYVIETMKLTPNILQAT